MRTLLVVSAILALCCAARAQTPDLTPSQLAIKLGTAINSMAENMDAQRVRIDQLGQAVAKYQMRVKELEDKYEPKPSVAAPAK